MKEAEIIARLTRIENVLRSQGTKPMGAQEAAGYLGVSLSYLYKLTHEGLLSFSKPNGKKIYFRKEDLDTWALKNRSVCVREMVANG